jgi:hypothetical protein
MTRARDGRRPRDRQATTPRRAPAAARRSSPAAPRGTSTRSEQRRSTRPGAERADRSDGARRSTPRRRSQTPRRGHPAGHSWLTVVPQSRDRNRDRRRRSAGTEDLRALCNALCNGLHSARPLIPDSAVLFRASWIRPRPPYVHSSLGQPGSDPVLEQHPDRGSAGGRTGRETERQRTEKTKKNNTTAATSTATPARREKPGGGEVPWASEAWRRRWLA